MQKYGKIVKDKLELVIPPSAPDKRDKPVKFAAIPEFDQLTQAVFQAKAVDRGDYIEAGVGVRAVVVDEIKLIKEPIVNGGYSADEGR